MKWNELYPQTIQPGVDDMAEYIGAQGKRLWQSLFAYMDTAYKAKPKLSYSVCAGKPGWNVKFQKSGQSFGTLYPDEGFFSVFIVIAYKLDTEMEPIKNHLSEKMQTRYDSAQDYMKVGKWMMFDICEESDLQDYKLLMSVKLTPQNQR